MTALVKHVTRRPLEVPNATAEQAQVRNSQLRARFPARVAEPWWPHTAQPLAETLRRLTAPPFHPAVNGTRAGRRLRTTIREAADRSRTADDFFRPYLSQILPTWLRLWRHRRPGDQGNGLVSR